MTGYGRATRFLLGLAIALFVLFTYLPMVTMAIASFLKSRYFQFPPKRWSAEWYGAVLNSLSIRDFFWNSITIALLVAFISTALAFFGALALARYEWRGRKLYEKILLLPILFPQAVLGLALLLWFTAFGILPSWRAAVFAHTVWIAPIVTLIVAIQVYAFDAAVEEAAYDLGASRLQVLREVTLPLLAPGLVSGFLSAFLLSWANFPLSLFSTGTDQTLPLWISAKMQAGYTPEVPAVGTLTMAAAFLILIGGYAVAIWQQRRRRRLLAA